MSSTTRHTILSYEKEIMLELQNITYILPDGNTLLSGINLTLLPQEKVGLVGKNGVGKSVLLSVMNKKLVPQEGQIMQTAQQVYHVPQHVGQFDELTVAAALGVQPKLAALQAILHGQVADHYFETLQDDWTIEDRCIQALETWQLRAGLLTAKMSQLSGGEKTKVFLAGLEIHQPDLVLMDEPTNHLDSEARQQLYDYMQRSNACWVVVSHDQTMLNQMGRIVELVGGTVTSYPGNYTFYREQRRFEEDALHRNIEQQQKALRKAKEVQQKAMQRQQRTDARGQKKQEKAGVARIMMNTLRNKAEQSTSKMKTVHADKMSKMSNQLSELRSERTNTASIKIDFEDATLHNGKVLFEGKGINVAYNSELLWLKEGLDFRLVSGDRVHITGQNGSGKSTLLHIILGQQKLTAGTVQRSIDRVLYLDQDYSMIDLHATVYEQAQTYNVTGLQEHEVKTLLSRYLFSADDWSKPGAVLSGGERMRLLLCGMAIGQQSPALLVLDEPTNNLDLFSLDILANAVRDYRGTLLVVSHDAVFVADLGITRSLALS